MKQIFLTLSIVMLGAVSFFAQTREPSTAIRPYTVKTKQSMADLEKSMRGKDKVEDFVGGEGMQLRVAVQHDEKKDTAQAELHDASDDVYYVLDGTAILTLGGTLDTPKEVEPGEWRGPKITGGQKVEIAKGDLVVVPRGTPHHRSTLSQDFTMILIKVWEDPRPAPAPAAAKPTP